MGHRYAMLSFTLNTDFSPGEWWVVQDSNLRPID